MRPLGLKNTDNKAVAGALNSRIRSTIASTLHGSQRGFLSGRQPALNIIEMDAFARACAMAVSDTVPIAALYDFMAAFLSVAHEWVRPTIIFALPDYYFALHGTK